ncbi:hypothetical protein F5884DRAFT_857830 [Xylogone sp. PMI_703]|nr:hypothetical protein F5884DRAFT_857830 [Xylogone sp. PMI_703]
MSNFPKLVPAFTALIEIDPPLAAGTVSRHGSSLNIVPFKPNSGSLKSEPNYPIQIDAVFAQGSDFIRADPSGKHLRLNVNSALNDKSGAVISYSYTGTITLTPEILAVLGGSPEAKTTEFGNIASHVSMETGSDALKDIESKIYVGSGRFIVGTGGSTTVEYKVSEVVP